MILSAFPAMAEDVFFAPNMPDVPVTEQMMMVEDSDFSFTSDNGLMSEVIYQTPQSVSDVQKFYAETLPSLGWDKTSAGVYRRLGDVLAIRIEKDAAQPDTIVFIEFQSKEN